MSSSYFIIVDTRVSWVNNKRQIIIGGLLIFTAIPGRRNRSKELTGSHWDWAEEKGNWKRRERVERKKRKVQTKSKRNKNAVIEAKRIAVHTATNGRVARPFFISMTVNFYYSYLLLKKIREINDLRQQLDATDCMRSLAENRVRVITFLCGWVHCNVHSSRWPRAKMLWASLVWCIDKGVTVLRMFMILISEILLRL